MHIPNLAGNSHSFHVECPPEIEQMNSLVSLAAPFHKDDVGGDGKPSPPLSSLAVHGYDVVGVKCKVGECVEAEVEDHLERRRIVVHHGKVSNRHMRDLQLVFFASALVNSELGLGPVDEVIVAQVVNLDFSFVILDEVLDDVT